MPFNLASMTPRGGGTGEAGEASASPDFRGWLTNFLGKKCENRGIFYSCLTWNFTVPPPLYMMLCTRILIFHGRLNLFPYSNFYMYCLSEMQANRKKKPDVIVFSILLSVVDSYSFFQHWRFRISCIAKYILENIVLTWVYTILHYVSCLN